jgi:hypothetical protein
VLLNHVQVGKLSNGGELVLDVDPGRHVIQVKQLGFNYSAPLSITAVAGEAVLLESGFLWALRQPTLYVKVLTPIVGLNSSAVESKGQSPGVQVLNEEDIVEVSEVVEIENFPLDNLNGSDALITEIEVSKTVTNELTVTTDAQAEGRLAAGFDVLGLDLLKVEISAHLSRQVGQKVGETVSRRQMLRFSVQPGCYVNYAVLWKRRVRSGIVVASVGPGTHRVRYEIRHGLSHEVKTSSERPGDSYD